jgi:toxin ParE1/3/4
MSYQVLMTDDAARDLEEIHEYVEQNDGPGKADYVLGKIESALNALSEIPRRGAYPKELLALGIRDYREIFFKPYRIVYRVLEEDVCIFLVADGRRDMQTLLQRRVLRP